MKYKRFRVSESKQINEWLEQEKPDIRFVSVGGGGLTDRCWVCFVYYEETAKSKELHGG